LGRPQELRTPRCQMTSIKAFRSKYRGTAVGDHGVFTDPSDGMVFAGRHANGCARIGVNTKTNGTTAFAEFDADGEADGRVLVCIADGRTWYNVCEHGEYKERALLRADGTCEYNGEACRADYAPFVALRAKVVPIKARHSRPIPAFTPTHMAAHSGHRPCFGTRRSWPRRMPTRCALPPPQLTYTARATQPAAKPSARALRPRRTD
jgi:hypothetical protein